MRVGAVSGRMINISEMFGERLRRIPGAALSDCAQQEYYETRVATRLGSITLRRYNGRPVSLGLLVRQPVLLFEAR